MDRGSVTYKNPVYFFSTKKSSLVLVVRTKITAFKDIKVRYINYLPRKNHLLKMKFKGRAVNKYNDIFGKIVILICIANFNQTIKDIISNFLVNIAFIRIYLGLKN